MPSPDNTAPDQAQGLRLADEAPVPPVRVIAVTGGKGGVGKTTVSVNLALAFAEAGRKTLLLDMQTRKGTGGLSSSNLMATAKAWNAFCAGRTLKIIKVTGHDVHLAGTPFVVTA